MPAGLPGADRARSLTDERDAIARDGAHTCARRVDAEVDSEPGARSGRHEIGSAAHQRARGRSRGERNGLRARPGVGLEHVEHQLHACCGLEGVVAGLDGLDRAAADADRPHVRPGKRADGGREARDGDRQPRGRARLEPVALADDGVGRCSVDERDRLCRANDGEGALDTPSLVSGVSRLTRLERADAGRAKHQRRACELAHAGAACDRERHRQAGGGARRDHQRAADVGGRGQRRIERDLLVEQLDRRRSDDLRRRGRRPGRLRRARPLLPGLVRRLGNACRRSCDCSPTPGEPGAARNRGVNRRARGNDEARTRVEPGSSFGRSARRLRRLRAKA